MFLLLCCLNEIADCVLLLMEGPTGLRKWLKKQWDQVLLWLFFCAVFFLQIKTHCIFSGVSYSGGCIFLVGRAAPALVDPLAPSY